MRQPVTVIKISGHYLDDEDLLRRFARNVARADERMAIVHGGGGEITQLQEKLGIRPRYVDGLRVTGAESLALVEMALCGLVNKRLVRHLLAADVDAQGLSGVDRGLVRARQMRHDQVDMGFTGKVVSVRKQVINDMFALGVTPVIAPVSLGETSNLNLNADPVAGAIAAALGADAVVYISNVAGIQARGEIINELTRREAEALIASGVISGGMLPKVRSALDVLSSGRRRAVITDLAGWESGGGTSFVAEETERMVSEG
ncbi:MAG: acetylglutamate kinase [Chloroflexi bacterium]|nr:acetylglutamate kinase [Chloroflexota bacterium]MCY4248285.1 acetylglutamate kinase [Chloroflexota bacterium]